MDRFSFLNSVHPEALEQSYEQYLKDPDSMEPSWRAFFQGFDFAKEIYSDDKENNVAIDDHVLKEFNVIAMLDDYRKRGHLFTKTNPVRERRQYTPPLDYKRFGLEESDLDTTFNAGKVLGFAPTTLREIIRHLTTYYCESIGVEYMYIRKPEIVNWIQNWLNKNENHPDFKPEEKKNILRKLTAAVGFENFLHTKFVGQKRFSLEGNESLIPALDVLIERSADHGVKEFVFGMPHRGRLNVLANIFGKTYSQIFSEFESKDFEEEDALFDGDVKYHLGSTSYSKTRSNKDIILNLAPNPSHLETVNAIVEGLARAKIDLQYNGDNRRVLPVLIHGDSAIAGQGIVYEVIQMMKLEGYQTGGTIHVVINNQIGFTTNYIDARSSTYCTDIAKVTLCPVLHVNADDIEAVVHSMNFAADYRAAFKRDVFIDLLGYRRYGHNEGDEPRFTQPKLYKAIAKHPNPKQIYLEKLTQEGAMGKRIVQEIEEELKSNLETDFEASKKIEKNKLEPFMESEWKRFISPSIAQLSNSVLTDFSKELLQTITERVTTIPNNTKVLRKIERLLASRKKMVEDNRIDWGMAETLAYGSLLSEGFNVRISGEDVERGTFSHRHAVIKSEDGEDEIILLNHINEQQGKFEVYNSLLSEYGVLGFDYGYALASPNTLTIWEAQFGDFSNGAQIIIDQYISAGEDKWKVKNGLAMFLPHGYEGQGAEHSSARMERYLQLCGQFNMLAVNCTTPANFYHVLRKQMKANYRKPLIVFTPKSLLRHPKCVSSLDDLALGKFEPLLDDKGVSEQKIERLVFCSGKFYYDLLAEREKRNVENIALIRVEQLYPLPMGKIKEMINKYKNANDIVWTQEEPKNMGAWSHILHRMLPTGIKFRLISYNSSASPAPGSSFRFKKRHENTIRKVFEF